MIARIIPLKRLPRCLSFFDYTVPEELTKKIEVGQLITAPFRSSLLYGIVFEFKEFDTIAQKKVELKELQSIVLDQPIVSAKYLSFICDMAELYGMSAATLLKMGMMPIQKRKLQKVKLEILASGVEKRIAKKNALLYENEEKHRERILENSRGKTLILVPEIHEAEKMYEILPDEKKLRTLVWHSKLSTKEQFSAWFRIRNGEYDLIIGTRAVVLLPFYKLDTILVDYEHDENHKQFDQAPRFHVKDIITDVAAMHDADIAYMSYTMSLDTYFQIQKNALPYEGRKLDSPKLLFKKKPNPVLIFERTAEAGTKNFTSINPGLQEKILDTSLRNEDMFIFVNRKEDLLPALAEKEQKFRISTQMVEAEVKLLLKNKNYQIIRVEKNLEFNRDKNAPCTLIGTQAAFPHIDWQKTALIIYLDLDRQLAISEIGAAEHVWNLLARGIYHMRPDAEFIVQTGIPDHVIFRSIGEPDRFYRTELSYRQQHNYPPYSYMVRYYLQGMDYENTRKNAKMIHENIKETLTQLSPDATLTNLFELNPAIGSQYNGMGFAIKFSDYDKEAIKRINNLLPDTWKIDPSPLSLTGM